MRILRWVLLALGVLFLLLGNVLWWVDGTLFNSEHFAAKVDQTLAKPEVQERIATVISQQAANEVDVQDRLRKELPDDLKFIASFAGDELEQEVVYRVTLRLLSSDFTSDSRNQLVEGLHERVVATLESDNDRLIQAEGDSLVLDLRPLVDRVFDRLGLAVPERLQTAQAEGRGVVTLVDNTQGLQQASFFVSNRVAFLVVALLLALACFAAVVFTDADRMRGIRRAGFAVAATGVVTLLIIFIGNQLIPEGRIVLEQLTRNLETNLRRQSIGLVALGAVVVLLADAGIRANISTGWHSATAYAQRLGTAPVIIGIGFVGLLLFLA